jgi:catechol 2,3-dioxygenase-like lactoylglutathione lyase family enzyme
MFKRIDHVELVTADPERAVRFYTEVLGFKVRSRDAVPGGLRLVYLDLGDTTVELITYESMKPAPRAEGERLGWRMMALEVEDMDKALAHLQSHGIAASWGPKIRPAYARAEIRDPDGNAIELRQWYGAPAAPR